MRRGAKGGLLLATLVCAVLLSGEIALAGEQEQRIKETQNIIGVKPYRQMYLLPYSYNNQNHFEAIYGQNRGSQLQQNEVKFQISFQGKVTDFAGSAYRLGVAYTQQSYWQAYNKPLSAPFRENNFEPEVFISWGGEGITRDLYRLGFDHQSNGRTSAFSRSWNRVYGEMKQRADDDAWVAVLRGWVRVPEKTGNDDNPDITRFYGHWQFDGRYSLGDKDDKGRYVHNLHLMLRNNLRINANRGALQLDWSLHPEFFDDVSIYTQFFYGYGENLIEYDRLNARFGIGILLTNW